MLWSFLKGIIGNYIGTQRSKPVTSIVQDSPAATVEIQMEIEL